LAADRSNRAPSRCVRIALLLNLGIWGEDSMALTFYYGSGSPFAWKVWLTLEHKGIPYEFRLLSFDRGDTRTPEFRAVNPRGRVPAIVDDGFALRESGAIVEYLEERYREKPLLPQEVKARATARRIALEADGDLGPAVGELTELAFGKEPADPAAIAKAKQRVLDELAPLEAELAGPYLVGALSLADFAVFPRVRMLRRIEDRKPGSGIAEAALPPKLQAWTKRIQALPYYEKTIPPHWKN
jgi:glutathione S-transferase